MNIETLWASLADKMTGLGMKLLAAIIVFLVGWLLVRFVIRLIDRSKWFEKIDKSARSFIGSMIHVLLYAVLFLTVAGILGIPLTSFVTILASAGVAIGLALQGALANFVGGIMILLVHPFRVGDYIETASESGTVEAISVFYTVLSTPDNKKITIPNGSLTNAAIVNYSTAENRRVDLTLSVDYGTDMEKVKGILLTLAENHEKVLQDPAPVARLLEQADSSLNFVLRAWCKSADYWDVFFDLNEAAKKRFDEEGISIPFPQVDVHMK